MTHKPYIQPGLQWPATVSCPEASRDRLPQSQQFEMGTALMCQSVRTLCHCNMPKCNNNMFFIYLLACEV